MKYLTFVIQCLNKKKLQNEFKLYKRSNIYIIKLDEMKKLFLYLQLNILNLILI